MAGLPPVLHADARLLILGSLPGTESLRQERYYAHPRNHFWTLMSGVIGTELAPLGYAARLAALTGAGVALWDAAASAERPGSLDAAMRAVKRNDLAALAATLPRLVAAGFNGGTAWRLGAPLLAPCGIKRLRLPSSSPAYTLPLTEKAAAWARLRAFL